VRTRQLATRSVTVFATRADRGGGGGGRRLRVGHRNPDWVVASPVGVGALPRPVKRRRGHFRRQRLGRRLPSRRDRLSDPDRPVERQGVEAGTQPKSVLLDQGKETA
jgi:hypothetical protein